jgi:hypothetical protein
MKNIIIPTTFAADTVEAMKIAAYIAENTGSITLLSNSPISDSITELLFLSSKDTIDAAGREKVLADWQRYADNKGIDMTVEKHHQFGMSRPLLDNVLEKYDTDLVVTPQSFQQSKNHSHRMMLSLLNRCTCPVMLLPDAGQLQESYQRALYLDEAGQPLSSMLQHLPFHIIHSSMLHEAKGKSLMALIDQMNVDLIVQRKRRNEVFTDESQLIELGLPILTV